MAREESEQEEALRRIAEADSDEERLAIESEYLVQTDNRPTEHDPDEEE